MHMSAEFISTKCSRFGKSAMTAVGIVVMASVLTACGGGGGGSSSSGSSSGSSSTGTLSTISDTYKIEIANASSGNMLTVTDSDQTAGTAMTTAASDDEDVQRWHVMPMGSSEYNIENMLTHQVMGIDDASTTAGSTVLQWADNSTDDHLWKFYLLSDGNYLIKNVNSSLYLTSDGAGTITQEDRDTTSTLQEWTITITDDEAYPDPETVSGEGIYVHDPAMIEDTDGTYWLYGTHNTLAYSTDLSTFTAVDDGIFATDFDWWADENTASDDGDGRTDLWAPDVMYYSGTYYQYYSVPIFEDSTDNTSGQPGTAIIALATSSSADSGWSDVGTVISSADGDETYNAIDPHPYIDADGNWWMSFGSWYDGTHTIALDSSTGLMSSSDTTIYDLGYRDNGEEGSDIFKHTVDGTVYYYYLASINACCDGTSSTYRIIVGRSTSPTGPFYDRGGLALTATGGTILLSSHGSIYGPGGQTVMQTDGDPLLVYHYYDGNNAGTPTLGLNYLKFDSDGWPYVTDDE